eukprot:363603-Chlamydomonas_euryale.AAC.10
MTFNNSASHPGLPTPMHPGSQVHQKHSYASHLGNANRLVSRYSFKPFCTCSKSLLASTSALSSSSSEHTVST